MYPNLQERCKELLELEETGTLSHRPYLDYLAEMLNKEADGGLRHKAMAVAIYVTKSEAIKFAATVRQEDCGV